jgi:hypothetical protein
MVSHLFYDFLATGGAGQPTLGMGRGTRTTMGRSLFVLGIWAGATSLLMAGGGGGNTATTSEVKTLSERIPAGGTVQAKYLLTQPRPITTGGPRVPTYGFAVLGVSATSPLGDTAGAALMQNGALAISIVSPSSDYGTNLDYPFMTVSMGIPSTTTAGSTFPLQFPDSIYQTPTGPVTLTDPKPGTLTIGGTISISGVFPGGGTWGAGTTISVRGTGFLPSTKIVTKMRTTIATYISPTEMQFALTRGDTMDSQPITASNPDGSQATFYSYLRGSLIYAPSRDLLRQTDPIFQNITHGVATVGPIGNLAAGQYTALAIQNPTPGPVVVSFTHQTSGITTTVTLPSCTRVMDELGALLGGVTLLAGDQVLVRATSGVQILGLLGDDVAGTMTPFLPLF